MSRHRPWNWAWMAEYPVSSPKWRQSGIPGPWLTVHHFGPVVHLHTVGMRAFGPVLRPGLVMKIQGSVLGRLHIRSDQATEQKQAHIQSSRAKNSKGEGPDSHSTSRYPFPTKINLASEKTHLKGDIQTRQKDRSGSQHQLTLSLRVQRKQGGRQFTQ